MCTLAPSAGIVRGVQLKPVLGPNSAADTGATVGVVFVRQAGGAS